MRDLYYDQLDSIADELVAMTDAVRTALLEATNALLHARADAAESVISGDRAIDEMREMIEERALSLLATQQPVATDLRQLIATLRMVADLERMGDLAVHVAKIARMRMPQSAVPDEVQPTIARMADVAERMISSASQLVTDRDVEAAGQLESEDDEMDKLRRDLFVILLSEDWSHGVEPAVDIALLGRYYERIGDHAVSMARRIVYLVTGEHPTSSS